jgi:hypothetical protein
MPWDTIDMIIFDPTARGGFWGNSPGNGPNPILLGILPINNLMGIWLASARSLTAGVVSRGDAMAALDLREEPVGATLTGLPRPASASPTQSAQRGPSAMSAI